jgi:hypothetical protein
MQKATSYRVKAVCKSWRRFEFVWSDKPELKFDRQYSNV